MKSRRIVFGIFVPAMTVLGFSFISVLNALGANTATSTSVDNVPPSFTAQPVESWVQSYLGTAVTDARSESSDTYPTNMVENLAFTTTATDVNNDNYYLIVCEQELAIPGNNAAPTCMQGVPYCTSASTASGVSASCSTSTAALGNETYNWYAYVCDHNISGTCSFASTTSQGGTQAEKKGNPAGSPFHINHVPTFDPSFIADTGELSIQPGDTVRFQTTNDRDTDVSGASDTMNLYVCSGETDQGGVTTGFDYRSNTCIGGTLICTHTGVPDFGPAWCDETAPGLVSIPTAHATDYTIQYYMEDSHDFGRAVLPQDYAVTDVAPIFVSYNTTMGVTLTAGNPSAPVTRAVTFTDNNGDNDPTALDLIFFDNGAVTDACPADENNCYRIDNANPASLPANCSTSTRSAAGSGKTASGVDNSLTVSCDYTLWFNANASSDWELSATATDQQGDANFADSNSNTVTNALSAIGVTQASIAYGTIAVGGDSTYGANTQTSMENQGNQILDVLLSGTNMTAGANSIPVAQQKWHQTNADFNWASGGGDALMSVATPASGSANGCLNRDMAVRNVHDNGTENETIAWKIRIPSAQQTGSYTGTNTFATAAVDSCTGSVY